MKIYKIAAGTRCLIFRLVDNQLDFYIGEFKENSLLSEADLFDSPTRQALGTSMPIDDSRFGLMEDFAKRGFYVFQRWIDDNRSKEENRILSVIKQKDVREDNNK